MKNTKDFTTIVAEKKATLEVLEALMEKLSFEEEYVSLEYKKVGEHQRMDEDGNPLFINEAGERTPLDTGKPAMVNDYDYVKKLAEELTDKDKAKLTAIEKIRETLAALA